jgi:hydrogenase maturation protease
MSDLRTLILAWGNAGRIDDGLGPRLAAILSDLELPNVDVVSDYQLQVEFAWEVSRVDRVVFVDASRTGVEPFSIAPLEPERGSPRYTSHELSPGAVLALALDLYAARPEAWLLGIRGFEFDAFGERLSPEAKRNLDCAAAAVEAWMRTDETGALASAR